MCCIILCYRQMYDAYNADPTRTAANQSSILVAESQAVIWFDHNTHGVASLSAALVGDERAALKFS